MDEKWKRLLFIYGSILILVIVLSTTIEALDSVLPWPIQLIIFFGCLFAWYAYLDRWMANRQNES